MTGTCVCIVVRETRSTTQLPCSNAPMSHVTTRHLEITLVVPRDKKHGQP